MPVKPIPDGFHSVTPYLVVHGVENEVQFLKRAFGAEEVHPLMKQPDGRVMHAEVRIGDSILMLGEPLASNPALPAVFYLYVADTDAAYRRALAAGATSEREPATQFYGDRNAGVKDPAGNSWWLATHVEDVPPEELRRRSEEFTRKQGHG